MQSVSERFSRHLAYRMSAVQANQILSVEQEEDNTTIAMQTPQLSVGMQ